MQHPFPISVGVTGKIASGKSTLAEAFAQRRFSVFNADDYVHTLYCNHKYVMEAVKALYPESITESETICRTLLRKEILKDPSKLGKLEHIVFKYVSIKVNDFVLNKINEKAVILDIPLLFEANLHLLCDYIIYVDAAPSTIRERVLNRETMDESELNFFMQHGISHEIKIKRSHLFFSPFDQGVNRDSMSFDEYNLLVDTFIKGYLTT